MRNQNKDELAKAVAQVVEQLTGVSLEQMNADDRRKRIAEARRAFVFLCVKFEVPHKAIARVLKRDPNSIRKMLKTEPLAFFLRYL